VAHGAFPVAMLGILCVALIVCVALMSAIHNCDIMFARVLTPAPDVVSCLSLSHRSSSSRQAALMTQRQPNPQQELSQLLDEFADPFDDRSRRCDAVVRQVQATDGLVRRQSRPCRAPDVCPVSRPIRPSNSLVARPIEHVFAIRTMKGGNGRNACDSGYPNSDTVGDAFLMQTIDEVLRDIDKGHVMRSATTFINQICCHANEVGGRQYCILYLLLHLYVLHCIIVYLMD